MSEFQIQSCNYAEADPKFESTEASEFRPKPYIFRSHTKCGAFDQIGPDQCIEQRFRFPEFNLLLDHTLAVIWMCQDRTTYQQTSLSEEQLQWAIRFLLSIKSADEDDPSSDLRSIIERMQNKAFEKRSDKLNRPKTSRSMPIIEGAKAKHPERIESFSFHETMSRLCTDKLKGFVQLLGVGDASRNSSVV